MGRRAAELVLYEPARPFFHEPITLRSDHAALACSRSHVELFEVVEASHAVVNCARRDDLNYSTLQGRSARHDDPEADRTFAVEPLKIFKIAIKKRIFVVPFDFESNGAVVGPSHMVDFM